MVKFLGYVLNRESKELWNLYWAYQFDTTHMEVDGMIQPIQTYIVLDIIILKLSILITSFLIFIVSTTLVSLTQREVQLRICQLISNSFFFTLICSVNLSQHIRTNLPYRRVIGSFVVQTIVFIMLTLGVFLTMAEFVGDRMLSLMIVALLWWYELFATIRCILNLLFPLIFFQCSLPSDSSILPQVFLPLFLIISHLFVHLSLWIPLFSFLDDDRLHLSYHDLLFQLH